MTAGATATALAKAKAIKRNNQDNNNNTFDSIVPSYGENHLTQLKYTSRPYTAWALSCCIVLVATILLIVISSDTYAEGHSANHGWKYIVALILYTLGIWAYLKSRVICLRMDKELGIVSMTDKTILQHIRGNGKEPFVRQLRDISNIKIETITSNEQDGPHCYQIQIVMENGDVIEALESRSKTSSLRKVREMEAFLEGLKANSKTAEKGDKAADMI